MNNLQRHKNYKLVTHKLPKNKYLRRNKFTFDLRILIFKGIK
jgi:hypothetical protein